jgi:hypothetical protein
MMKQERILHPRATLLLLAAVALPAAPLMAQDAPPAPDISVTPVTQPDPIVTQPPPVSQPPVTEPAPVSTTTPPPAATTPTPATEAPAAPERRAATRTARTTARAPAPARSATPARQAAPAAAAAAPVAAAAPPAEAAPPAAPAPAAAPLPVPEEPAATENTPSLLMWAIGGGLLLLLGFALFSMLRHRRRRAEPEHVYDEEVPLSDQPPIYTERAPAVAAPAAAGAAAFVAADQPTRQREVLSSPIGDVVEPEEFSPATNGEAVAVAEEAVVANADAADVETLAAGSAAPDGRPWLEFMMRPVRAGTSKDSAIVEFELTVGNTGDAPARDVRISTFMFAAGAAGASEMERMLIDPPADAAVTEVDIAAGDATRVDATMSLPREGLSEESVLPVVVADARYRLPDGTEGHTRAQFEVGIPSGEGLDPFPTDRSSGLLEGVEARLHGEPERV